MSQSVVIVANGVEAAFAFAQQKRAASTLERRLAAIRGHRAPLLD